MSKSTAHTPPICRKQLLIKLAGGAKIRTRPSLTKRNAALNVQYQDNALREKRVYGVIFFGENLQTHTKSVCPVILGTDKKKTCTASPFHS